jgi:hypothetical protein
LFNCGEGRHYLSGEKELDIYEGVDCTLTNYRLRFLA